MVHDYDHPIENKLLDTFEYLEYSERYEGMDEREFLIEHGVTTDDIKNFYEAQGEIAPKLLIPTIKKIFNDNNIETKRITVNNERKQYIIGLIRK